jgi:NADH-quinone oxidoreductase subunit A
MNSLLPAAKDPVGLLVFFLLVFAVVGIFFLFIHMLMGKVIRPSIPDAEKLTIYECGEPTVGSAWIQFDLRFYVVALLFVIFDVEVAFFFPWATVFGKANQLANLEPPPRVSIVDGEKKPLTDEQKKVEAERLRLSKELMPTVAPEGRGLVRKNPLTNEIEVNSIDPESASAWARIAFWDLLVFFGVLMVGFAYVWRRGDIDWVRAYAPHHEPATPPQKPLEEKAVA